MSTPADQLLADLEEAARPMCDGHVHGHRRPAEYAARIHQVDCCEPRGDNDPRALTSDGAIVQLLCIHCLAGTAHLIQGDIANRLAKRPRSDRLDCRTCGRPIASLHDILETERLK
ncbi:hypothetical protein [Mycobacterium canetti]|uniref:hypothetical protein n=1 Tax=Mycobacterium canetti TaxID=78331 RepID=UPI00034DA066|nr:hypothetical protein [Mycobacterium canetti]